MQVGVVGLGAIGKVVAANLVSAGLRTTVWNRSAQPVSELVASGAVGAEEVGDVLQSDIVLSFLFDDAAVREVFLESGILASVSPSIIHVCMSTISTGLVQELVQAHTERRIGYVAAPFFGRPEAAAAAKLNIVTAAAPHLLDQVEPILSLLGRTWRMGDDPQFGHLAKIAGNFMLGCAIEAMQESAALISSHGGDPAPFLAMMGDTLLAAPVYRMNGPAIASGGFMREPSALRIALKDIGLALGEATTAGTRVPFAEVLQERLNGGGAVT